MIDIPNPFRGDITDLAVREWLEQFEPGEQPVITKLLEAFRYYGSAQVAMLVKGLYEEILQGTESSQREMWFVPVGYVAKSGSIIAYYFRVQNNLPEDHFVSPADLSMLSLGERSTVVFIDDFLGTGNQAQQVWETVAAPIYERAGCDFVYATLVAYENGLEHVRQSTGFHPFAVTVLSETDSPFSDRSKVFENDSDKKLCEEIIEKYGKLLYPNHPFGYRSTQGLVGFFYSTPNNTLPIFWSSQNGWHPLLARGDSYRDPAFLIGPPPGLNTVTAGVSPTAPVDIIIDLQRFNIPWESLVRLGSEFKDSKVVLVLASIIEGIGVERDVLEALLDLIRTLRDFRHEKEPVRSAIHLVPADTLEDSLGLRIVQASAGTIIRSESSILALANITDGLEGGIAIRADGTVLGNFLYPETEVRDDSMLPRGYQRAAYASLSSGGVIFVFLEENRIAVFHRGHRVLWHRGAAWHLQSSEVDRGIRELSNRHDIDYAVLERVTRIAFQLSDLGKGALITVGDHHGVVESSDPPKSDHIHWSPLDMSSIPISGLIGLMSQDGATIVSGEGEIVQTMTTLRPPTGVVVNEEIGRGTKHSTAAKISAICNSVCIAVSVDGRITVYSNGEIAFKVMG